MTSQTKYSLLGVNTERGINIGDYIQALASSQFPPSIDRFIQRENLKDYDGDPVRVIMNGWYMHNPSQWPPSEKIDPLFVAFHINVLAERDMMSSEGIAYLKRYEPIGCRDRHTVDILCSHGIDAYFSGCMTLTLGHKYKSESNNGRIYFVDPAISLPRSQILMAILYFFSHIFLVKKIVKKRGRLTKGMSLKELIKEYLISAHFCRTYSRLFEKGVLLNAVYIEHQSETIGVKYATDNDLLKYAESLVKDYAEADFVVTSRIHCALPCLGLETPVLFTQFEDDSEASKCRFDGIIDLFTVIKWNGSKLIPEFNLTRKILSRKDFPANKIA